MCEITNFYEYKYCRRSFFINIFIDKESALGVKALLVEKIKDKRISNDYRCAYIVLRNKINEGIDEGTNVKLRMNKCYLQYLKDLYYDFYDREESIYVKELICHIQYYMKEDASNIYKFYDLRENTKINILSKS